MVNKSQKSVRERNIKIAQKVKREIEEKRRGTLERISHNYEIANEIGICVKTVTEALRIALTEEEKRLRTFTLISQTSKNTYHNGRGLGSLSKLKLREIGLKNYENSIGAFSLNSQERRKVARRSYSISLGLLTAKEMEEKVLK